MLGPVLLLFKVLSYVLPPLAPLLQWLVSRCWLIALVLEPLAPLWPKRLARIFDLAFWKEKASK